MIRWDAAWMLASGRTPEIPGWLILIVLIGAGPAFVLMFWGIWQSVVVTERDSRRRDEELVRDLARDPVPPPEKLTWRAVAIYVMGCVLGGVLWMFVGWSALGLVGVLIGLLATMLGMAALQSEHNSLLRRAAKLRERQSEEGRSDNGASKSQTVEDRG